MAAKKTSTTKKVASKSMLAGPAKLAKFVAKGGAAGVVARAVKAEWKGVKGGGLSGAAYRAATKKTKK